MAGWASFERIFLAVSAAVLLAGCSHKDLSLCPAGAALAPDAVSMTVLKPGAQMDLSSVLYNVQIVDVKPDCDIDKKQNSVESSLDIDFRDTRAPNGEAVDYTVPYFVAVIGPGNKIVAKYPYSVAFSFAPGQSVAEFSDSVDSIDIELGKDEKAYAYSLFAGLQLTRQQLEYNRTLGHYAQ